MKNLDIPETLSDESLEAIRSALIEVQSDREQTALFLDEMLDGMESMRQQIESHEQTLRERRDQLSRREAEMRRTLQELEERATELASCEEDLRAARHTISELQQSIVQLEAERDVARQRLDAAADELASVADVLSVLDVTQRELGEAREQLVVLKEKAHAGRSAEDDAALQQAIREKEQLEAELRKSKEEIQRLNDRVRAQSDELTNLRQRWSGDLESMRDRLIERAKGIKQVVSAESGNEDWGQRTERAVLPRNETQTSVDAADAVADSGENLETDSVIGSVLAQLADLQDE